ncbi:MAG: alpha-acetolactate decarboxylase [Nitrospirae bacterium RBG_13_39_12]|nr:MAG: alpha-acetolactate decarboxylase [Nitrospirae bacterium RBG_13_39_12]
MKFYCHILSAALFAIALAGCLYHQNIEKDVLFQTSTINALLEGVYDGDTAYKEIEKHGDFGIGTFNALDGEMIGLDGIFYQIKSDGIAYLVDDSMKSPFAVVTFFEPDKTLLIDKSIDYNQLEEYLDNLIPTKNIFYAIKFEGLFSYIKVRSAPRQNKPYPPLVDAVKDQTVFEFYNVRGMIVGFRLPDYMKGLNVPGYHFHFITEDRKAGGHLLECIIQNATAELDYTTGLYMVLPEHDAFYRTDLSEDRQKELENIER